MKNFGHDGEINVVAPGINGKMSEFNAALGLLQLRHIDRAIAARKDIDTAYREALSGIRGIYCLNNTGRQIANYAYFPIMINDEYPISRDELYEKMKTIGVHTRRYFYPLISDFSMYREFPSSDGDDLPNAKRIASQVLCLPIYPGLDIEVVEKICRFISEQQ